MAALMAVSRVYVGVHWPTDVAAGLGFGALVAVVPLAALARAELDSACGVKRCGDRGAISHLQAASW